MQACPAVTSNFAWYCPNLNLLQGVRLSQTQPPQLHQRGTYKNCQCHQKKALECISPSAKCRRGNRRLSTRSPDRRRGLSTGRLLHQFLKRPESIRNGSRHCSFNPCGPMQPVLNFAEPLKAGVPCERDRWKLVLNAAYHTMGTTSVPASMLNSLALSLGTVTVDPNQFIKPRTRVSIQTTKSERSQ